MVVDVVVVVDAGARESSGAGADVVVGAGAGEVVAVVGAGAAFFGAWGAFDGLASGVTAETARSCSWLAVLLPVAPISPQAVRARAATVMAAAPKVQVVRKFLVLALLIAIWSTSRITSPGTGNGTGYLPRSKAEPVVHMCDANAEEEHQRPGAGRSP